jgi:tripartite-type tricarboxylate transporter receptor subunit TctC
MYMRLQASIPFVIMVVLMAAASSVASAQPWPTKSISVVVPFSAGSATDIIGRTVFEQVGKQLGTTVLVENRVGAGGTLAEGAVARAAPDGYTILFASSAHTVAPLIQKNLPYDPRKDLVALTPVATQPNVLVVSPSKGVTTLKELVDLGRAKPGSLNYATVGLGTASHVISERLRKVGGFEATMIPFKGSAEGMTEVMTGRVDFFFTPILQALSLLQDRKIIPLAVASKSRATALPDVPTTIEAGFPNSEYEFWFGAFLPANTPRHISERLHREILEAVKVPVVYERISNLGGEVFTMSSSAFETYVQKEFEANEQFVRESGLNNN